MKRFHFLMGLALAAGMSGVHAASIDRATLAELQSLRVGERLAIPKIALGEKSVSDVVLRRIEVYAPDAVIYVATANGLREVPRNDWVHFVSEGVGDQRLGLSIAPGGRDAIGTLMAADGKTYALSAHSDKSGLSLVAIDSAAKAGGSKRPFSCTATPEIDPASWPAFSSELRSSAATEKAASRSAVIAVDTDNEVFASRFAESTSTATTYLAGLFVGMNLIYERDLDLTLMQGTTILRPSSQPDPYTSAIGSDIGDQLDEFGENWVANHAGVSRAFAMQISGKQFDANPVSGPWGSEGLAWNLNSPAINYCTSTNLSGGTSCADGLCTAGHYSVSRIFKPTFFTPADDLLVVAHELGHNFGLSHTHCTDSSTGAANTATNTIDQCYSSDAPAGCYAGPTSCPVATTVNGLANVEGTLMSYCHFGQAGPDCDSSPVFADRNRSTLSPKVQNNLTLGCFSASTGGGNDPIFQNGFE